MNLNQNHYPDNPLTVSPSATAISPSFKSEVKKVICAILVFFIVYHILILLSIALTIICMYAGVAVIEHVTYWIGILAGIGIISIGIMVFVFLIKFIFSVKKFDETGSIRLNQSDQPELFNFILQLTKDTQTQFPKKIIISPEVNASVFYNDSFWSMLFPVKKNLQIGLGLVNSLTLSEFKAVMAHEFGHFSQRSMKLGSFVYNVNKAIYNMLYENKDYAAFLQRFGNLHSVINLFVSVTVWLVQGIQKVLQSMYGLINKKYFSLSRQMEFHADAVAASVSGSENLVSALRKLEVSNVCYNTVIQKANEFLNQHQWFENIYATHDVVMKQYAADYDLPLLNNVPLVPKSFFQNFQLSKVNIQDQWASHPTREEREEHLLNLNIDAVKNDESAWVLFNDPLKIQKEVSEMLYKNVPFEMKLHSITEEAFHKKFTDEIKAFKLPAEYNGFYDNRQINEMDLESVFSSTYDGEISKTEFKKLFSDENVFLSKQLLVNQSDAELLKAIINNKITTKTFDYDGEKYSQEEAPAILEKLNKEIEEEKKQLQQLEEKMVAFFIAVASKTGDKKVAVLEGKYINHFESRKKAKSFYNTGQSIIQILSPILQHEKISLEYARRMAGELRTKSTDLKPLLKYWLQEGVLSNSTSLKEKAELFINADYQYFTVDRFFDTELGDLHYIVVNSSNESGNFQFISFKKLLEYQLELLNDLP